MTDLTNRQLVDTIVRTLDRMARAFRESANAAGQRRSKRLAKTAKAARTSGGGDSGSVRRSAKA